MKNFFKNKPTNIINIREIKVGFLFPISYINFLCQSNGGEGNNNNDYIYIWQCEDIPQYNIDYEIHNYFPKNIIMFGMNGDLGYFFDFRLSDEPQIVSCALGDLDVLKMKVEAKSFEEFIKFWI